LACGRSATGSQEGARIEPHRAAIAVLARRQQDDVRPLRRRPAGRVSLVAKSRAGRQPTIGWMPPAAIFSENSGAPNMLSVSVSASAGCRSALAAPPAAIDSAPAGANGQILHVQITKPGIGH
jgi:hypothetical protein